MNSMKSIINELLDHGNMDEINYKLNRMVKDIDKNIHEDDDWGQFEIHFDEVHDGFIRKLREDFPEITPQEIKLCAYLRMNMTSKEIANILRITVRGVEMSRYRLRKKLHLEQNENLIEFMMNL